MKLIIKQIFISFLFLTISLGGCGDFEGNYEEVETDYNSTNSEKFVAVGERGTILTSSDGTSWTSRTSGIVSISIRGVSFGNSKFVVVGGGGTISTSTDGITWEFGTSGTSQSLEGVIYSK